MDDIPCAMARYRTGDSEEICRLWSVNPMEYSRAWVPAPSQPIVMLENKMLPSPRQATQCLQTKPNMGCVAAGARGACSEPNAPGPWSSSIFRSNRIKQCWFFLKCPLRRVLRHAASANWQLFSCTQRSGAFLYIGPEYWTGSSQVQNSGSP